MLKNIFQQYSSLLSVDIKSLEKILCLELGLSADESRTFQLIVKVGNMTPTQIQDTLRISLPDAQRVAGSLVKKGMLIETAPYKYESLHPKFAVSNRYKTFCEEKNIDHSKNNVVDNIGIILERDYENARRRTK